MWVPVVISIFLGFLLIAAYLHINHLRHEIEILEEELDNLGEQYHNLENKERRLRSLLAKIIEHARVG